MADQKLDFGALHQKLGGELSGGMNRLRAKLFAYIEMLGLPHQQTEAFKQTAKAATTEFWSSYERLLLEQIAQFGIEKKDEQL